MAALIQNSPFSLSSSTSLFRRRNCKDKTRIRGSPVSLSIVNAQSDVKKEDIVIIGAGIAGLATAVSLQRLGIRSLVLEQTKSLRTEGISITLSTNGWKVLDAIGVGDDIRTQFLEIQGLTIKSDDGRELSSFNFKDEDQSQEIRAVERRIVLETLANQLPPDAISFSSKLSHIETSDKGETLLKLENDTQLSAKIVIACDGVRSPVAKWMGFNEPRYVGHVAFRGLGLYPNGQPFEQKVKYTYGRGVRGGYVPLSSTKVYWFIIYNSASPGPKITDPSLLRQEAEELVGSWSTEVLSIIKATPDDMIIRNPLVDRWLWPGISPPASTGTVVLVGDAWHPMTPNLGQGACCALEDAIVLAKKLEGAIKFGTMSVEDAFMSYGRERWPRVFPLTIRSHLVGSLLQSENPVVCYARNNIIVPKLVKPKQMFQQAKFEFERLY